MAEMLKALKQGRIVFLMLDQGVKKAKDGIVHRFLGKDMPMSAGPAQLARAARAPVLPLATTAATPLWRFALQPPLRSDRKRSRPTRQPWSPRPNAWCSAIRSSGAGSSGAGASFVGCPVSIDPLWVLLGDRHGDNRQLLAIADALQRPYRRSSFTSSAGARSAPARWFAHRLTWRTEPKLAPPWPHAILAAGRKSVPAALWIQRASGGRTRLIHVNRPWAPLAWFDLVVTTPQYALPERANVLTNLLPFVPPQAPVALPASFAARAASLPRPWTAVLVGGNSRPFVLDDAAAARLAATVNAELRAVGGSAWVLDSPRTPASAMATLERALEVPAQLVRWGRDENCYAALLGLADRFIVTADSASMLTEALLSGRPVTPFALPARGRLALAGRRGVARRGRERAAVADAARARHPGRSRPRVLGARPRPLAARARRSGRVRRRRPTARARRSRARAHRGAHQRRDRPTLSDRAGGWVR